MTDTSHLRIRVDGDGISKADRELQGLERTSHQTEKATDRLSHTAKRLGGVLAGLGITLSATAGLRASIRSYAEFEQGLIGVSKTTGIVEQDLDSLGSQIRELTRDIPLAASELLGIAQAAGQLGVEGVDNIVRFTATVGRLGLASNLSGEEAATSLARILTVTGESIEEVDRLGSTIVRLGNNFAATESEIAHVATAVAQSTAQFEIGASNVIAISTAMRAMGIDAAAGGTQVGLAFQSINDALRSGGQEMESLQRITGRTREEMEAAFFDGRSTEVFQAFVEGLGRIKNEGGDVSSALGEMGLTGVRAVQVLGTLSTRASELGRALELSNDEWEQNTALIKEAAVASTSFNAQLQLMKNAADEAGAVVGGMIAPHALDAIHAFRDASLWLAENMDDIVEVGEVLVVLLGARVAGAALTSAGAFTKAQFEAARYQLTLARMQGVSARAATSQLALASATNVAKGAMTLLGGPGGIITIAAAALYLYATRADEASKANELLSRSLDGLGKRQLQMEKLKATDSLEAQTKEANKLRNTISNLEKDWNRYASGPDQNLRARDRTARRLAEARAELEEVDGTAKDLEQRLTRIDNILSGNTLDDFMKREYGSVFDPFEDMPETATQQVSIARNTEDLDKVRESLRREEEIIQESYQKRRDIILKETEAGSADQAELLDRLNKQRDEQLEETAFGRLQQSLQREEEAILDSYNRRLEMILANTEEGSVKQRELLEKLNEQFATDTLGDWSEPDTHEAQLEAIQDFYERRRQLILDNTELTEEERTKLEEDLTKRRNEKIDALESRRHSIMLNNYSNLFESLADISETFGSKQSGIYKTMFAVSKAFAIAESIINIQKGIASAASMPFPTNLGAMATVAAQTAGILSTIKSTKVEGIAHGGLDNVPKESTYLLDKGERVLSPRQNQDLTQFMKNGGGGGNVLKLEVINRVTGEPTQATGEVVSPDHVRIFIDAADRKFRQDLHDGRGMWREAKDKYNLSTRGAIG